jgi:hypothetical protein
MKCQLTNPNFKKDYLANILTHRGVTDIEAFLNPSPSYLQEPIFLDNIEAGAQLLIDTLRIGGNIFTIADCDVDGATSFAIIYQYLHDICDEVHLDWEIHTGKQHGLSDFIDMIEDSDKAYDLVLITDAGSNDYEYIERLGNMGTKGNTTGVHCHIEIAQAKYTIANWHKNKYGIWCFPKEYPMEDCSYMNDTNIIKGLNKKWKYLPKKTKKVSYYKKYTGKSTSLVDALASLKINYTFDNRKKIAIKNGIKNYTGKPTENEKLLKLLKSGKLIK